MSSERQRKFHKQKSHSDENIQMGIYTTEALAYQPENEPIQLQNDENQKKTSQGVVQIDFDEQMKASIKDFNYFQKNEEEISEKMLQKSSKSNIKYHKKSNSDENIIMNNTQEISLKFNSDHQESDEEERFNTLHMQNSNNSEIQSQENLPAENFNKILEKNTKQTDEFNDFNNFGEIQKKNRQFQNKDRIQQTDKVKYEATQQKNDQNYQKPEQKQYQQQQQNKNQYYQNQNYIQDQNSQSKSYYSQSQSQNQVDSISNSNNNNSSQINEQQRKKQNRKSEINIPTQNVIQRHNFFTNQSQVDQKYLLEMAQDYIKITNFWYYFSYFIFLLTIIALCIYIFFPNRKSNTLGLISVLIQFLDSGLSFLGSRYGKKVFMTFNYRFIKKAQKYFTLSFIPQVISIVLSEVFFILADKSNQALFMLYIFVYQLLQVFMIYSKVYQIVKKGQDLSDLIRAFEIQQSQDPNAPHLKQLVQQKLLKKGENLQLQTDTQNNLQQKKQEQVINF